MAKARSEWEFEVVDYDTDQHWAKAYLRDDDEALWYFYGPDRTTHAAAKRDLARLKRMVRAR